MVSLLGHEAGNGGNSQGRACTPPRQRSTLLHYVLDLWFSHKVRKSCRGEAVYFRFADDFLACFERRGEAIVFLRQLGERLKQFGLELATEKTHCIEFGRFARRNAYRRDGKPKEFTFLGFTHYCGKTRNGYFKVKRRTSRKKFGLSLRKFGAWIRYARHKLRKGEMLRQGKIRIVGHLNYYAITDNSKQCARYVHYATRLVFKWINRKSQRRAYHWAGFNQARVTIGWPTPSIRVDLNPCRRAEAF